jgi:hypothetical protein
MTHVADPDDAWRSRLRAAFGFDRLHPNEPELRMLHGWLDSWRGLGDVVDGMMREGLAVDLAGGPEGWSAWFLADRPQGGAPEIAGSGHEATPWGAVQRAAWAALAKIDRPA